ncbi:unannotated protein [freshwater metagenome]|uniref:Unannotated protein n=1 Tax=freshwater metagenome TaxID=449393 RepID=A0A6J7IB60_9ZZZZ
MAPQINFECRDAERGGERETRGRGREQHPRVRQAAAEQVLLAREHQRPACQGHEPAAHRPREPLTLRQQERERGGG